MRSRWSESAFRPDPSTDREARPLRAQSISLLAVLVLVAGAVAAAGYLVRPDRARSYQLLHGSIFLADQVAPVGIDLASGKPTLRLVGAEKQVGARSPSELAVVPLDDGTLLLDRATGQFNMVDNTGFVIKHDNGGVPLPARTDATASTGVAAGTSAYVERTGTAGTDVYLVDQLTVQAATNLRQRVAPRASTRVGDAGSTAPGASAAVDGSFWALLGDGNRRTVQRVRRAGRCSTWRPTERCTARQCRRRGRDRRRRRLGRAHRAGDGGHELGAHRPHRDHRRRRSRRRLRRRHPLLRRIGATRRARGLLLRGERRTRPRHRPGRDVREFAAHVPAARHGRLDVVSLARTAPA